MSTHPDIPEDASERIRLDQEKAQREAVSGENPWRYKVPTTLHGYVDPETGEFVPVRREMQRCSYETSQRYRTKQAERTD